MTPVVRGVLYVSVWVVLWGTVASLIDWVLLAGEVYGPGSFGQASTFIAYGAATVVLAVRLSGRFLAQEEGWLTQRFRCSGRLLLLKLDWFSGLWQQQQGVLR